MAKRRTDRKQERPSWQHISTPRLHGREKLAFALGHFSVSVAGKVAFDCGASTGGFTQALLDGGAERVYAVDAGFGQLLGSLRQDDRVVNLERTNLADARTEEPLDVVALDLSYLALADAIPQLRVDLAPGGALLALVKPMFELRLGRLPEDQALALSEALRLATNAAVTAGWTMQGETTSPVLGRNGALEGFIYATC
jgi:23S rRNA (cytidine1920-2'-O)/16S rRNA (cytidine1409-2'-O)-methyltransferase